MLLMRAQELSGTSLSENSYFSKHHLVNHRIAVWGDTGSGEESSACLRMSAVSGKVACNSSIHIISVFLGVNAEPENLSSVCKEGGTKLLVTLSVCLQLLQLCPLIFPETHLDSCKRCASILSDWDKSVNTNFLPLQMRGWSSSLRKRRTIFPA